jgi:hypothetical protein
VFDDIGDSLQLALRDALSDFFSFIPNLLGAILLLLVGWFLGKLIGGLVAKALQAVGFNKVAAKAEIDDFLRNAGVRMDAASVVGAIARWFIYLVFFLAAFNALGLEEVSAVIDDVLTFLPKVVVAIIILLVGALAGTLLAGLVKGSLRSMGLSNPDLFGTIARFAVIAFAAIAALDMLEIAPTIVATLWQGLIFGVVGILVLAFGLGGRQAASDLTLGRLLRAELEPGVEIQAGAHRGTVRTIGSLFTTLETEQGVVKVPNTELTSQPVMLSRQAFQQQVEQREAMKAQAKQALQSQANGSNRPRTVVAAPTGNMNSPRPPQRT